MDEMIIGMHEAKLNVSIGGEQGDLDDPVNYDATDDEVRRWATEAIRAGNIRGISARSDADFTDYRVDRIDAKDGLPNRLSLRPKTPYGV